MVEVSFALCSAYPVTGNDTVAKRCKAASVKSSATVWVVNNTCMQDPSPDNFAALYSFTWTHERCHLTQQTNVFPTIPDPRVRLETLVRSDSGVLNGDAVYGPNGFNDANAAIAAANTIDKPTPQHTYFVWGRYSSNTAWNRAQVGVKGILAPEC
jgi:hypothetical protein